MLADFVKESISSGGTGNITLGGAVSGFVSFNAVFSTTHQFYYCIEDGTSREVGLGHLSASTTLVRDKILGTLVAGTWDYTSPTAISASTSGFVFVGASASAVSFNVPYPNDLFGSIVLPINIGNGGDVNVSATATQRVMFWPICVHVSMELTSISYNVSGAAASTNSEFGIYDILYNGRAGNLIATTGAASVATTGFKTVSLAATKFLPAGWYVAACVSDHATNNPLFTGSSTCWASVGRSTVTPVFRWRYDVGATSLASTAPATSLAYEDNTTAPRIWLSPT